MFCSPFDKTLAHSNAASIFLPDQEGALRFHPSWTRDCWGRAEGPHGPGWRWVLARDRATRFVQILLVTSPTLLTEHPRLDLKSFEDEAEARAELAALGSPAFADDSWADAPESAAP